MTIFHLFEIGGVVLGGILGYHFGNQWFGIFGGIILCVIGLPIGYIVGKIPFIIGWKLLNIKGKTTEELREIFKKDQYFIYHLALPHLMARGEDIRKDCSIGFVAIG